MKSLIKTALSAIALSCFFLGGCATTPRLTPQELAEQARLAEAAAKKKAEEDAIKAAKEKYLSGIRESQPSKWKPALENLFADVEKGNSIALEVLCTCTGNWDEPTAKQELINNKFLELVYKNNPKAARHASWLVRAKAFKTFCIGYNVGYCIDSPFLCRVGMRMIDDKLEGSKEIAFLFSWVVGSGRFRNSRVSTGRGDPSYKGIEGIGSYSEKFFTNYLEKSDPSTNLYIALGIMGVSTTQPFGDGSISGWDSEYRTRGINALKKFATSGDKDAMKYLSKILHQNAKITEGGVLWDDEPLFRVPISYIKKIGEKCLWVGGTTHAIQIKIKGSDENVFPALAALIEAQKSNPNPLMHESIMKYKEKTTEADHYDYIEKNYQ